MKIRFGRYWIDTATGDYGWNGVPSPDSDLPYIPVLSDVIQRVTDLIAIGDKDEAAFIAWKALGTKKAFDPYVSIKGKLGI